MKNRAHCNNPARRCLAGIAVALGFLLSLNHATAQGGVPALTDRLSKVIPDKMIATGVPGMVVVLLADGVPVWTRAFGFADLETGRAMPPDALFRVESISKPVTAWGAMRLATTGRLDLDAPISDCLTDWHPPMGLPAITTRQLLSNTAGVGLGDYGARYAPNEVRPDLAAYLTEDFLMIGRPGTRFAYSDTGFNLVELEIEVCTASDFADLMRKEVLLPLGMDGASYAWTGLQMPVGHDLRGQPVPPYVYPGRASGGLHATAADIARFAAAGMGGAKQTVLPPHAVAEMHHSLIEVGGLFGLAADGYGLGHFTEMLSDGRAAVWHGGQGYGWMSHLHMVPETGDGIVILANSQRAWPLFAAILRDWSESLGVAPVGMARVLWAGTAARVAIGILAAVTALILWAALGGRPLGSAVRIGLGIMAVPLLLWPLRAATAEYLFLFSILPALWPWLAASSGLAGLGLGALALTPVRVRQGI
ncbi:CubicO group peptidase, beta-lactamase class C family [Jannaschia faecimaris]|uniref:CubicO group peptidase, beta-lactamase class C family n=1 Tax=Jannaschia faecimaris TaxID=1244108 RepID=A0A1H3PZV3_9RHOB|nr:serine hydrolase domain-containing protein [Jannaschia faecimaris]SDZ06792.1 CubicO group peptidase, beta-lactamase class C family [Jannaschia faecimaris]